MVVGVFTADVTAGPRRHAARRVATLLCSAALAAAAGCQTGDEAGPADRARGATEAFLESCARGKPVAAELALTEPARKRFITAGEGLAGCLDVVRVDLGRDPTAEEIRHLFSRAETAGVETGGGFARVAVTIGGFRRELELEMSRGLWLISNPLPLPG